MEVHTTILGILQQTRIAKIEKVKIGGDFIYLYSIWESVTDDQKMSELVCRKLQQETLLALFGEREAVTIPSIFIYGHTGTGKSYTVKNILENLQAPHVIIDCVECFTTKLLFERILGGLSRKVPSPENDYTCQIRCENMNDFARLLKQVITDIGCESETVYIILDKAERLREMDANILPAFLRLQELTGCNICVLLLSEIVWEKFRFGTGYLEPYILHFPDYTKDQILKILQLDVPSNYSEDFYGNYLSLSLSVFYTACRDLTELRHLAKLNFKKYIEPIESGEATVEDTRKLWRNIEPHLKRALQTVYLREISSSQWERMQEKHADNGDKSSLTSSGNISAMVSRSNMELPFYSKYLLIAAYIASYNPAKSDRRFFSKNCGRLSSRMKKNAKKTERTSSQLLGPKPFPLDRLMAIFYSIMEGRITPSAHIFSQISSLVTLQLLGHIQGGDLLDSPKYKCLVSFDGIKSIARTVGFDIVRYLFDFI
ncbi:unnamed protein product [Owenia fusiformis]|uniref:Origin recognition complex subunit 5 n=1 Tax=Owenia fusiformis TaxID=6347 RepID=A0A8J1T762_OWEFU|nr:unnamed protein product [Owenia fusiformis]